MAGTFGKSLARKGPSRTLWRQSGDSPILSLSERDLDFYAGVAEQIARYEIPEDWRPGEHPEEALRQAIVGTVLMQPVILALRSLAHEHRTRTLATSGP